MKRIFCRLYGHTWVAETSGGNPRWNTTKAGTILVATDMDEGIRYFDVCRRCGERREVRVRGNYDERAPSNPGAPAS